MKASEAGFKFPVMGFTDEPDVYSFPDLATLTRCGRFNLKENAPIGVELVDSKGRRWAIRAVHRLGRGQPLIWWLLSFLISTPQYRVEYDLEPLPDLSLDEVKSRAAAEVRANADVYTHCDDSGAQLRRLLSRVEKAKTLAGVSRVLGPDTFEGS